MATAPITRNRTSSSSEHVSDIQDEEIVVPPARKKRSNPAARTPVMRTGSPEQLVQILMDVYYLSEVVTARLGVMGVAVFLRLGEDAIEEVVTSHGGTTIELAYLLAARDDMKSGLEEEANIVLPPVQPGFVNGIPPAAPANNEDANLGGAQGGALKDPYLEGEDDAGKELIYALFGAVGGVVATECSRMQTNTKQGVSVKGTATIYIPELGVELKTTDREETVMRARVWLVIIRTVCKMKWEQLGQRNWVVNVKEFFISMINGLSLDSGERRPYQRSVPYLNNIKAHKWATDHKVMGHL